MILASLSLLFIAAVGLADSSNELARQISRTGNFHLPCSPDVAFPLFSPEGERGWIKTWDPRPVYPETITFARDTVFCEGHGTEEAVWTIISVDWQTHRAEYVRLAPASHSAHVVVRIEPVESGRSLVTVSYTITAFGTNMQPLLESFSETAYGEKMQSWQRQIGAYLDATNTQEL